MKKMLVDFSGNLIRIAIIENSSLKELIVEQKEHRSIVSNIYIGVVRNILPSQFVFLDIGQDKNAFLQLNDKKEAHLYDIDKNKKKIKIKRGQELLVQVIKDSTGNKGAVVTSQITYAGKNLVLISNCTKREIGVSRKISDEAKRKRLKKIALKNVPEGYGVIFRTSSENLSEEEILSELKKLIIECEKTNDKAKYIKGGLLVGKKTHPAESGIKELFTDDLDEIVTNDEFESIKEIVGELNPEDIGKVKFSNSNITLFRDYDLESSIDKLLNRKIWLKSGGFLIIEQSEACVIIDVNTGKFSGKTDHDKTVLKTNIEASKEICKQIKLRNLSGMIIIDFIDMKIKNDKDELHRIFSEELAKDRISTNIVGMTKLGLMQVTRKKTRESLSSIMNKECPYCGGTGLIPGDNYIANRILVSLESIYRDNYYNKITITAGKSVIDIIKNNEILKSYGLNLEFKSIDEDSCKIGHFEIGKEKLHE